MLEFDESEADNGGHRTRGKRGMSNQLSINESEGLPDILSVGSIGEKDQDFTNAGY